MVKIFKLNEDKEYVERIRKGLEKKNGHCPCKIQQTYDTICPCKEFLDKGDCACKLYVKK